MSIAIKLIMNWKGVTSFERNCVRKELSLSVKRNFVDNCLRRSHVAKRCRFNAACMMSGCGGKHHSLLHQLCSPPNETLKDSIYEKNEELIQQGNEPGNIGNCSAAINSCQKVCLSIVPVKVSIEDGKT